MGKAEKQEMCCHTASTGGRADTQVSSPPPRTYLFLKVPQPSKIAAPTGGPSAQTHEPWVLGRDWCLAWTDTQTFHSQTTAEAKLVWIPSGPVLKPALVV